MRSLFPLLLLTALCGAGAIPAMALATSVPDASPAPPCLAALDEDDDAADDAAEIPPPPRDNFALAEDLDPKVKADFEKAFALYEKSEKDFRDAKNRRDAIQAFTRLKKSMPGGQAHFYLGVLYQWEPNYKKARNVLEELLAVHPEFYEAHVELGDVEVWEKDLAAAVPHYQRALAVYSHFEYGVDRMMTILVRLGRFEEAKPFVERALLRGHDPMRLHCQSVVKFVVDGPEWEKGYTAESENYVIMSDVSQEFAAEILDSAELIRELYDNLFPEIEKPDRKYPVFVFKDRQGYLANGAPETSKGVYMPFSRRLMLYQNEQMGDTLKTLKHEGFHQYCHEYLDNIPQWFNEGLADYFSASELVVNGKIRGMRIRPVKERISYLVRSFEVGARMPSLPELMHMTQREMYDTDNDSKSAYLHYCQAWSICFFCIDGRKSGYRSALINYFKALRRGKSGDEAYSATFGQLNMKNFENEWRSFMQKTFETDKGI